MTVTNETKPHLGRIKDWYFSPCSKPDTGLGVRVHGEFLDHPHIFGGGNTSEVITHNPNTGEIVTRNSRYTLVTEGEQSRRAGWPHKGDKMIFLGRNGYESQLEAAMKVFTVGQEYEVEKIKIYDFSHSIWFVGINNGWNGVMFEMVSEAKP